MSDIDSRLDRIETKVDKILDQYSKLGERTAKVETDIKWLTRMNRILLAVITATVGWAAKIGWTIKDIM
jgi:hypothetical protein